MTPITHLYLRPLRRPTTTGDSAGPQDSGLSRLPGEPARGERRCALTAGFSSPAVIEPFRPALSTDRLALVNGQRPRSDGPGGIDGVVTTIGCVGFVHDAFVEGMVTKPNQRTQENVSRSGWSGAGQPLHPTPGATGRVFLRHRAGPSLLGTTVATNWRMPIWAREETAMPATACTEDAMEALDDHGDATVILLETVRQSIADRRITEEEAVRIEWAAAQTMRTKGRVQLAVERTHYGVAMAMSYLRVGKRTPKLERKDRELMAGIISLEERLRERETPVPA